MKDTLYNTAEFLCSQLTVDGDKIRSSVHSILWLSLWDHQFPWGCLPGAGTMLYTQEYKKKNFSPFYSENKSSDNMPLTFDWASAQSVVPVYRGL